MGSDFQSLKSKLRGSPTTFLRPHREAKALPLQRQSLTYRHAWEGSAAEAARPQRHPPNSQHPDLRVDPNSTGTGEWGRGALQEQGGCDLRRVEPDRPRGTQGEGTVCPAGWGRKGKGGKEKGGRVGRAPGQGRRRAGPSAGTLGRGLGYAPERGCGRAWRRRTSFFPAARRGCG